MALHCAGPFVFPKWITQPPRSQCDKIKDYVRPQPFPEGLVAMLHDTRTKSREAPASDVADTADGTKVGNSKWGVGPPYRFLHHTFHACATTSRRAARRASSNIVSPSSYPAQLRRFPVPHPLYPLLPVFHQYPPVSYSWDMRQGLTYQRSLEQLALKILSALRCARCA